MKNVNMEKIVALCKGRGFIYPGSEIYGGLANTWDYGPLGARLKNNIKDTWRKRFIQERKNSYEIDADILMHPRVWEASGHVASFSDPLIDCKECKMRHRADNLINDFDPNADADAMTQDEMMDYIKEHKVPCPNCGKSDFTDWSKLKKDIGNQVATFTMLQNYVPTSKKKYIRTRYEDKTTFCKERFADAKSACEYFLEFYSQGFSIITLSPVYGLKLDKFNEHQKALGY